MVRGLLRSHLTLLVAAVLAAAGGVTLAAAVTGSAATPQVVTLGDTNGTPDQNLCPTATTGEATTPDCTYVSFSSGETPELEVPFDGTVTSFSVNSGSTATVRLRVLRPTANGAYVGAGTSAPEVVTGGSATFTTSLPVKAGDVLGLDNASNALLFDDSSGEPDVQYFLPALADGQSGKPNPEPAGGYRLLLAATVQSAPPSTTGTTTTTTGTTTTPRTTVTATTPHPTPSPKAPKLGRARQTHASWSEPPTSGGKPGRGSGPVGTTFSFTLNEAAQVRVGFTARESGRRVGRRCAALTSGNSAKRPCTRLIARGAIHRRGHAGSNHVAFKGGLPGGTRLRPGRYMAQITATSSGRRSGAATLRFTIRPPK